MLHYLRQDELDDSHPAIYDFMSYMVLAVILFFITFKEFFVRSIKIAK